MTNSNESNEGRIRGIAELIVVHKDKDGKVLSSDQVKNAVTYRLDASDKPIDIQPEEKKS